MTKLNYVKPEKLLIKNHPNLNEKWVQEIISNDTSVLGLGDLIVKDKERKQPHAGRLDLLLQDPDSNQRYEVEIQLGQVDESHIIRTIEYWDVERKRYPQYDHTAVLIAEDITSRFLNVIGLFNGFIPLVAIQMNAMKVKDNLSLVCTTVVDHMTLGLEEEEELETVDRSYWEEKRGTKETVAIADKLLEMINTFDDKLDLKYNKHYIGLAKDGMPNNFALFRPRRNGFVLNVRLNQSAELDESIEKAGFDVEYIRREGYRIRLTKKDVRDKHDFLLELLKMAYDGS